MVDDCRAQPRVGVRGLVRVLGACAHANVAGVCCWGSILCDADEREREKEKEKERERERRRERGGTEVEWRRVPCSATPGGDDFMSSKETNYIYVHVRSASLDEDTRTLENLRARISLARVPFLQLLVQRPAFDVRVILLIRHHPRVIG